MDEEGRIRINGRKKEIIIRGGENICAREIDDDLMGCPGVGETATIGMPDERLGERICTFAVPVDERRPTVEDVTAYLAEKHVAKRLWPGHRQGEALRAGQGAGEAHGERVGKQRNRRRSEEGRGKRPGLLACRGIDRVSS